MFPFCKTCPHPIRDDVEAGGATAPDTAAAAPPATGAATTTTAPAAATPAARTTASGLGLCAFALSFFILNLWISGAFGGEAATHLVLGVIIFYGGVTQFVAGLFEFRAGDAFFGTAFCSYAAFFLSFAGLAMAGQNIPSGSGRFTGSASGTFFILWCFFSLILLLASLRHHFTHLFFQFLVFVAFLLLAIGAFVNSNGTLIAGAVIGMVSAVLAWWHGMAKLITRDTSYFNLPLFHRGGK
ncbi:uncharacterized protein VTP21DRAFT_2542 [Calcarisporiella thermophila]|uniref:uncharacterized protein n=1 Tax=Calcarisporiella thermophila TaxID=911321 RepID=UPI003742BE35